MNEQMTNNTFYQNQNISFKVPYFDGNLKMKGQVVEAYQNTLLVKYKTCVGEIEPYKMNELITEIPHSFIVPN